MCCNNIIIDIEKGLDDKYYTDFNCFVNFYYSKYCKNVDFELLIINNNKKI